MVRWADIADAEHRLYTAAEVEEMVKQFMPMHSQHGEDQRSAASQLPHQREIPTAVSPSCRKRKTL